MANYKWKIEYQPMASLGGRKEKKFIDYNEMCSALGAISMISWKVYVYCKVKGKWEHTRTIEGHIN